MPKEPHPTLQVLAVPVLRLYLAARFFSGFGRALVSAMLAYHVYDATGSYAALGILGLVEFLPVIPISLLGGVVADRFDRRILIIAAHLASLSGIAVLAFSSQGEPGEQRLVYGAAFLLAITAGFANPAATALLPGLVPREVFQNATVVTASISHLAFIAGPITMGLLIGPLGFGAPYATAAACYAISIAGLSLLRIARACGERPDISLAAVREGIAFVWSERPLLSSMTLDLFAVIFASATALLPVYAEEILRVGPVGYGVLRASMAVGTFTMTLFLMVARPFAYPGRALLWAVAVFGVATFTFGLSRSFPLSVGAFVVAGMADQVSMTMRSVILQLSTPDALRGRVSAVSWIFIGASNELGDAESGFLAYLTNATFAVVAGALACLGVTAAVAVRVPDLRQWTPAATAIRREGDGGGA